MDNPAPYKALDGSYHATMEAAERANNILFQEQSVEQKVRVVKTEFFELMRMGVSVTASIDRIRAHTGLSNEEILEIITNFDLDSFLSSEDTIDTVKGKTIR